MPSGADLLKLPAMKKYDPSDIRRMTDEQLHRLIAAIQVPDFNKRTARGVLAQRQRETQAIHAKELEAQNAVDNDRAERQTKAAETSATEATEANKIAKTADRKAGWALMWASLSAAFALASAVFAFLTWYAPRAPH